MKRKKTLSMLLILTLVFSIVFSSVTISDAATYTGKYWLKVNEQRNVITAYKKVDGKWKPIRAMLCSTGLGGATPKGTFYTQGKWRWGALMNDVYGQYCTHITEDILFHSVYYKDNYKKNTQVTSQFNLLGSAASHGCIRLSVMDAKWIYDNCKVGTKVTVYRSSTSGPLGKPKPIKVSQSRYAYWDPTDPDSANPYYIIRKPVITVSSKKKLNAQYGSKYDLKSYVNAKDPNTFMNLKSRIKVSKVLKYSSAKKKYVKGTFSTKSLGTYKVTYTVNDPYSKSASKTIKIKVVDNLKAPVISGAKNRTVTWGDKDALGKVTAKQASASRTSAIKTHIKEPGSSEYKIYSYASAKKYVFDKAGTYNVKYVVKNKYAPYKSASKTIKITAKKTAVNMDPVLTMPENKAVVLGTGNAFDGVSAIHNGKDVTAQIKISIIAPGQADYTDYSHEAAKAYVFNQVGEYKIQYSIKNQYAPYQTVTKTLTVTVSPQGALPI